MKAYLYLNETKKGFCLNMKPLAIKVVQKDNFPLPIPVRYKLSTMKKFTFFALILFLFQQFVFAQKSIKVSGSTELLMEDSYSIGEAKKQAVELAKIDALEKAFGRVIVQGTHTYLENTKTGDRIETNSKMRMMANSMVKGDWLETQKQELKWVVREVERDKQKVQELWLLCKVEGKAREIKESKTQLAIKAGNCPTISSCETTTFKSGESFFMNFKSSSNGFLSVFMEEDGKIYRLFPYFRLEGELDNAVPVMADEPITLFSSNSEQPEGIRKAEVDEFLMHAPDERLFNRIYVVFAEKAFKKPILQKESGLKTISIENFQKWIGQNKSKESSFQVSPIDLVVEKSAGN